MKKQIMKKTLGMLLCVVMVLALCSSAFADDVKVIRFSSASGPDDTHTQGMYKLKETIEELSGGKIQMDLYLNSTLFAQDAETEAIMSGDLDMCYVSSQWVAAYVDEANLFTAMYLYKDVDHLNAVLNGEIGQKLFDTVAEQIGVKPLAAYYYGGRDILMRKADKDIMSPADLKGIVMREPNTPEWLFVGEALGANPTPLAFGEMYTALQTGTIDAVANPLPTIITSKLYEVSEEVVVTEHILDSVWPAISVDTWNSLTEEEQGWMMEAIEAGRQAAEQAMLEREESAISFLEGEGLKVVYPDVDAFREFALQKYIDSGRTALWDMDLYEQIQNMA